MVRKLMKHELWALFRVLLWFMAAVLLLGVLARIGMETIGVTDPNGSFGIGIYFAITSLIMFWFMSVVALAYAAIILSVVRYFKSLFTGEGYLTFSLPATPMQLLVAKFLSALIATIACYVCVAASVAIMMPGYAWSEVLEALYDLFVVIGEFFASEPLIAVEVVLLLIAAIPSGLLYLYLIASIGQLFTKGRIAITIGLYYGVSFVLNFFCTLFIFPIFELALISVHFLLWLGIVLLIAFDVASFLVIRYILTRKVNLVV